MIFGEIVVGRSVFVDVACHCFTKVGFGTIALSEKG